VKVHVITLAFAPARVLKRGVDLFYSTYRSPVRGLTHHLVDHHYPIGREQNLQVMKELCEGYGIQFHDPGQDNGYHGGLNWILERIKPEDGDIVVMYDPDAGPEQCDWLDALVDTILAGYSIASLVDKTILRELNERGYNKSEVIGVGDVWEPVTNGILSLYAWDWAYLKQMLPLYEHNPYYGGIESYMWEHLKRLGLKQAYLPGFSEDNLSRDMADWHYVKWKWEHSYHRRYMGSFTQYLKDGCPGEGMPWPLP
jgi:hypothetical protein